jgi:Domain of unknown function (DUF6894)
LGGDGKKRQADWRNQTKVPCVNGVAFFLWLQHAGAIVQYYFNVTDGERTFKDEDGRAFASSAGAEAHAVIVATELAADEGWQGFQSSWKTRKARR